MQHSELSAQQAPKRRTKGGRAPAPSRTGGGAGNRDLLRELGAPRPLPGTVRQEMEGAMSADFSGVRLYESPALAREGVQAAASGSSVAFAPGKFDPGSQSGRKLLGHELGHVVQQARGQVPGTGGVVDSDALERQADVMGARAARGEPVSPMPAEMIGAAAPLSAGMAPAGAGIQLAGGKREHNRRIDEQTAALDADDAKYARWEREVAEGKADFGENGAPENAPIPEGEAVPLDLTALNEEAGALGWKNGAGKDFDTGITENFFREISGTSVEGRMDEDGRKRGTLHTGRRSEAEMMEAFRNHDEPTTLKVIQPLMELDVATFVERFPLNKMSLVERRAKFPEADAILQPMVFMKQWGEKYGITTLSEANQKKLVGKILEFEALTKWAYSVRLPSDYSMDQLYEQQVAEAGEQAKARDYTARTQASWTAGLQSLGASGSVMSYNDLVGIMGEKNMGRGGKSTKIDILSRKIPGFSYNEETDMVTCPYPAEDLKALAKRDTATLERYADKLRGMSWRDTAGKERRAAQFDSSIEEFDEGLEADAVYFGQMKQASTALRMFGGKYLPKQGDAAGLMERMTLAENTFHMMGQRANTAETPTFLSFDAQYDKMKNKTWIKRSLLGKKRRF